MSSAASTPASRCVSRRHSKSEFFRAYYLPSSAVKKSVLSDDLAFAQEFQNEALVLPPPSRHGSGLTTPNHACLDMTGFRKWKAIAERDRLGSSHSSVARRTFSVPLLPDVYMKPMVNCIPAPIRTAKYIPSRIQTPLKMGTKPPGQLDKYFTAPVKDRFVSEKAATEAEVTKLSPKRKVDRQHFREKSAITEYGEVMIRQSGKTTGNRS
mmetsp:Transcript_2553/g.5946  ORF Transcript_2553/g.5946 Transcript_2553/m.5946 type:complete len:210 (+) Transcript_2553:25-654(+)